MITNEVWRGEVCLRWGQEDDLYLGNILIGGFDFDFGGVYAPYLMGSGIRKNVGTFNNLREAKTALLAAAIREISK